MFKSDGAYKYAQSDLSNCYSQMTALAFPPEVSYMVYT